MPYDPNWPQNGQPVDGDAFRVQLAGIVDLIQAGGGIVSATIDTVTTGNPGDPATAGVSLVGATLHFTFGLPRGLDGGQGPPFANAVVDGVTTLDPGNAATVSSSYDGSTVHLTFGIPRGADGLNGTDGSNGADGPPGPPGPPGELTQVQLQEAISTTSANSNGVATHDAPFSDPDLETLRQKVNELIGALRR